MAVTTGLTKQTTADLDDLVRGLFRPLSLDDLLTALPGLLSAALGDGLEWHVTLAADDGPFEAPAPADCPLAGRPCRSAMTGTSSVPSSPAAGGATHPPGGTTPAPGVPRP